MRGKKKVESKNSKVEGLQVPPWRALRPGRVRDGRGIKQKKPDPFRPGFLLQTV